MDFLYLQQIIFKYAIFFSVSYINIKDSHVFKLLKVFIFLNLIVVVLYKNQSTLLKLEAKQIHLKQYQINIIYLIFNGSELKSYNMWLETMDWIPVPKYWPVIGFLE